MAGEPFPAGGTPWRHGAGSVERRPTGRKTHWWYRSGWTPTGLLGGHDPLRIEKLRNRDRGRPTTAKA